jgi:hypothetical protein
LRFFSKLWVAEDDTAGFGAIMRGIPKNTRMRRLNIAFIPANSSTAYS